MKVRIYTEEEREKERIDPHSGTQKGRRKNRHTSGGKKSNILLIDRTRIFMIIMIFYDYP